MASFRSSFLSAPVRLTLVALALSFCGLSAGCHGCDDASRPAPTADAGEDAGERDAGADPEPIPGSRPELSSPGEVVPLLWGRIVELRDDENGASVRFALDDPSQDLYVRFFSALDAACTADIAAEITAPSGILVLPGCGQDGAFSTRLHMCRASAGAAFIAGEGAGLSGDAQKPLLNLPERSNAGAALWSALSKDSDVRASWALFAVAELREAIASASRALDPATCMALDDAAAALLATDLLDATQQLEARTQSASSLLRSALAQVHNDAVDDEATRIAVTRALNHSLLEEQKLYAGIPYGAFSPLDVSQDGDRDDRYPALFASSSDAASRAATLIALTNTRCTDADGNLLEDAGLGVSFVAAVRAHEPLLFGHLAGDDALGVLSRLDLTVTDLRAGARLFLGRLAVSGAAILPVTSLDVPEGLIRVLSEPLASTGYVHATTAARGTRDDDDLSSYARMGLHHALDAARVTAERALTRSSLPASARGDLSELSANSEQLGTLQICLRGGDPASTNLTLLLPKGASAERYELWADEVGVACALDPGCDTAPYQVVADSKSGLEFTLPVEGKVRRYYLTARDLDGVSNQGRLVVASVSTAPLDAVKSERCYFEPLSAALHTKMRALHDRTPIDVVPRMPEPWGLGTELVALGADPVSVHAGRILNATEQTTGDTLNLDLGEPFSTSRIAWQRALAITCPAEVSIVASELPQECGASGLARALAHECSSNWAREVLDAQSASVSLQGLTLQIPNAAARLTLQLYAWDEGHRALSVAADVIDGDRCAQDTTTSAKAAAALSARLLPQLASDLPLLGAALEAEADAQRASESEPIKQRTLRTRALTGSRLATARLFLSAPRSAYEGDDASQGADPFDYAFSRFPVVTRDALLAEDARAESLLRASEIQPWLADLTVQAGVMDSSAVAATLPGNELALRVGARLAELDPDTYGGLPADAGGILADLGISSAQLANAAVRVAQTAEIRGLSLLPISEGTPLRALGMKASFPAPSGAQLAALSGGKLAAATDALVSHFALRGHYHTLARLAQALGRAPSSIGTNLLASLESTLAEQVDDTIMIEQLGEVREVGALRIERTVDANTTDLEAIAQTKLVFSEAGLSCALTDAIAAEPCLISDYLFDSSQVFVTTLAGAAGTQRRVRLEGFRFPTATGWEPELAREISEGRVYLLHQSQSGLRALAGVTLAPDVMLPVRHESPVSDALDLRVLELLAFKAPGEGCGACRPRSVCETTRCELNLCVREPVSDGLACGAVAVCTGGECSEPGCGDGARADGSDAAPYEACDDGNLTDGDGCSESCAPELRELEPILDEGWPAGPASAVGIDGLGKQLLVYTADGLTGDNQLIRAALLDAFGVQSGSERTLDDGVPRDFIARPCVAGLRDGGFAIVYGSPSIDGEAGIGVRIFSTSDAVGTLLRVDDGNATAGSARVASVEDGFVVVWSERSGGALLSRVRVRRFDGQGAPIGGSFGVGAPNSLTDQVEPTVVTSLGQIMVAWTERNSDDGTALRIRGQRFFPFGSAVDGDAFEIAAGQVSEPSLTVLDTNDYLAAWTSRDADARGDIMRRELQRFGLPLGAGISEPWVTGVEAQATPVVAGLGSDAVLAYQLGSPLPFCALAADAADADGANTLAAALASARERDVSAVSTPFGAWFVWSERKAQGRALYSYLLPPAAP